MAKIARAAGATKARVAHAREVPILTGFAPGAVAPFPLQRVERALIDRVLLARGRALGRRRLDASHGGASDPRARPAHEGRAGRPRGCRLGRRVRFEFPRAARKESLFDAGHREDLDERRAGRLGRREDPRRLARPALRHGRLRRNSLLRHAAGARRCSGSATTSTASSNSAKLLYMQLPYSAEELRAVCKDLICANGLPSCYLRPLAFYGYGELGVAARDNPVEVVIMSWPWGTYLGDDGTAERHPREGLVVAARRAERHPARREGDRHLPQLDARRHGGEQGRLRRGDHAHARRLRRGRLGREHLRRAATASSTRRISRPGSCRASRATRSSRSRRTSATPSSRRT